MRAGMPAAPLAHLGAQSRSAGARRAVRMGRPVARLGAFTLQSSHQCLATTRRARRGAASCAHLTLAAASADKGVCLRSPLPPDWAVKCTTSCLLA